MQLAGIGRLHVLHNVVEVNAWHPLQTFRCGTVRFFNNTKPNGNVVAGWQWDTDGHYDEPETLAEDAFILWLLRRKAA
jgi:hypothetical protein